MKKIKNSIDGSYVKETSDGKKIVILKTKMTEVNQVCKTCNIRPRKNGSSRCDKCSSK